MCSLIALICDELSFRQCGSHSCLEKISVSEVHGPIRFGDSGQWPINHMSASFGTICMCCLTCTDMQSARLLSVWILSLLWKFQCQRSAGRSDSVIQGPTADLSNLWVDQVSSDSQLVRYRATNVDAYFLCPLNGHGRRQCFRFHWNNCSGPSLPYFGDDDDWASSRLVNDDSGTGARPEFIGAMNGGDFCF